MLSTTVDGRANKQSKQCKQNNQSMQSKHASKQSKDIKQANKTNTTNTASNANIADKKSNSCMQSLQHILTIFGAGTPELSQPDCLRHLWELLPGLCTARAQRLLRITGL